MRVSYKWLKEYVDTELAPRQLADRLTMAGLEVEALEYLGEDDWALEVNVTPNRPDCLSVMGMAREVAALTRRTLEPPVFTLREEGQAASKVAVVEIKDPGLCPRYAGRVITGVKVGPSPAWMQRRLQAVGVRSVNNIVDVTNYVMMEMGQPLHAFDFGLLEGGKIVVRAAAEGEAFITLDGVERKLDPGMLLICDGERPVAVAGVMGGQNSEVGEGTADVFLESAYFDPVSVRRTSKRLGLHTEASHRFERGTDPDGVPAALDRAAALVAEYAGGLVAPGRLDEYPRPVVMPEVRVSASAVNALLGSELAKAEVVDILNRLQLAVTDAGGDEITVRPPAFRPDLTREADIIEEAARVFGYGRIKSTMPQYRMEPMPKDAARAASGLIKDAMRVSGFSEVINYSFIDPAGFDRLMLPEDDYRRKVVTLRNPLTVEQSVMRTTIIPSLLGNLAWNVSRGVRELKIFELSRVFLWPGGGLPDEPLMLSALASGGRTGSLWDGRQGAVDFFDMKGALESALECVGVDGVVFRPDSDIPFLHPGKAARVVVRGKEAGFIGRVHPDVMAAYDLPAEAYVFELDMQGLLETVEEKRGYEPLPKYPAIERDIAVIVPDSVSSFNILKTIESLKLPLIEDARIFDFYEGKPIPEGKKSLAYTITYRSSERTLTDDEVNAVHQGVADALKDRLGAEIREQ